MIPAPRRRTAKKKKHAKTLEMIKRKIILKVVIWAASTLLGMALGPVGLTLMAAALLMMLIPSAGGYSTAQATPAPVGYSCPTGVAAPAGGVTTTPITPTTTTVSIRTSSAGPASTPGTVPSATKAMPYSLPTTSGTTGEEETVNSAGQVPSTGGKVTWAKFAALGEAYDNYYINMRWNYAAWNFDGTSTDLDEKQYAWFEAGHDGGKPWMVTVTNPRTKKSVNLAIIEAGPGPWVGVTDHDHHDNSYAASFGWTNPTRGDPPGWTGIVSGMPKAAITTLDAITGYMGQQGDKLNYQWAADQNATPGPTGPTATALPNGDTPVAGCSSITTGPGVSGCAAPSAASGRTALPTNASTVPTTTSAAGKSALAPTAAAAAGGCGGVIVNGVSITIPNEPDVDPAVAGKTITAPNAAVARGLATGLSLVGMPYVYGGGTDDGPPDQGCSRAGGQLNSCQGIVGLDCSGLTGYILQTAGFHIATDSGSQRTGGTNVPFANGVPGDIMGFAGHVAMYLGYIDGVQYLLEAPAPGMNIHIRKIYWSNEGQPADTVLHRYWS